jgi:hypothetical protein
VSGGATDVVWIISCDEGGAGKEVVISPPSLLSELGVGGEGSALRGSAVNLLVTVKAGTPGNVLIGTGSGCASRFTSAG